MKKFLSFICCGLNAITIVFQALSHWVLLGIRIYLFNIFFRSGWLKWSSWEGTLALFRNEFKVWFFSPETAAIIGTASELIIPVFLVLGLGGRIPALALFIFNIVSVISYPLLLQPDYFCALKDHILWGVLIAWLILQGSGKISLDDFMQYKYCKNYKY